MSGGGGGGGGAPEPSSLGGKKNVFGETSSHDVSVNLTALMDILSNLLFFLLASFGGSILMMINATTPVQSQRSDIAQTDKAVTVVIHITKDRYEVGAVGTAQDPNELAELRAVIQFAEEGKPEYAKLSDQLVRIRDKYPESDTVIMTPEEGVNYGVMIKSMDAAREREIKVSGKRQTVPLFPKTVVSTIVK